MVQWVIAEVMADHGILPEWVVASFRRHSVYGWGSFKCRECRTSWTSQITWVTIDIKDQSIKRRFKQKCKSCQQPQRPWWQVEEFAYMVEFALNRYRKLVGGTWKPSTRPEVGLDSSKPPPHKSELCERCGFGARQCWATVPGSEENPTAEKPNKKSKNKKAKKKTSRQRLNSSDPAVEFTNDEMSSGDKEQNNGLVNSPNDKTTVTRKPRSEKNASISSNKENLAAGKDRRNGRRRNSSSNETSIEKPKAHENVEEIETAKSDDWPANGEDWKVTTEPWKASGVRVQSPKKGTTVEKSNGEAKISESEKETKLNGNKTTVKEAKENQASNESLVKEQEVNGETKHANGETKQVNGENKNTDGKKVLDENSSRKSN